jgi:CheY-like chemotaxis protein
MRLRYKILIFDNDPEWVESIKEDLIEIVESEGLLVDAEEDIEICSDESEFSGMFDYYDIILIDYDLGCQKGEQIIKKIRNGQHFTEVIFYSQGSKDLLEIISQEKIEGVYCSRRQNHSFLIKFEKVFKNSIKKVLDLNNLRGIVLAETSELDQLKSDIFKQAYKKGLIDIEFFEDNIYKIVIGRSKDNFKTLNKYINTKIGNIESEIRQYDNYDEMHFMNKNHFFTFDVKKDNLPKLLEKVDSLILFDKNKYDDKIQKKRNKLAHEPERREDDKQYFGSYEFNHEEAKLILRDITDYNNLFKSIIKEIEAK